MNERQFSPLKNSLLSSFLSSTNLQRLWLLVLRLRPTAAAVVLSLLEVFRQQHTNRTSACVVVVVVLAVWRNECAPGSELLCSAVAAAAAEVVLC